jgi:integrase
MAERNKPSSLRQVTRVVDGDLLPAWRGRPIGTITKQDVNALLDAIMDRGAKVKANRVHAALSRLFKFAVARELIAASPMNGLERRTKETSRERTLTDQELASIWHGAGTLPILGDIVKLLALTGMRREEATQLKWSEIDGDSITLAGARTKNGSAHIVPLSAPARKLLAGLPRIAGSEYVFTLNGQKPITGWSRAKHMLDESCGVAGWRLHDLRRTMATGCQKLGVTLQAVESILGHTAGSRAGVVGVYQRHDFMAEKRSAMEKWGKHVAKLVG